MKIKNNPQEATTVEVLAFLKDTNLDLQEKGVQYVSIEHLNEFISEIEKALEFPAKKITTMEADVEKYKAAAARVLSIQSQEFERNMEVFRSCIMAGQSALKSIILINGGASVAVLSFMGVVVGKAEAPQAISFLSFSLLLFAIGVFFASVASGFTYLAQVSHADKAVRNEAGFSFWNWAAVSCAILGCLSFFAGVLVSFNGLRCLQVL